MHVLQVSRHHWSYTVGGVESYVKDLAFVLKSLGIECDILTFKIPSASPVMVDNSIVTHRLPLLNNIDKKSFTKALRDLISKSHYDLAHFHFFRPEETLAARVLNDSGIPCIFTYHLPAASCYRGALMRWGTKVCNGEVKTFRCTACRIHRKIHPLPSAAAIAATPFSFVISLFSGTDFMRGFGSSPDYWGMTHGYAIHIREFLSTCRYSIACGRWSIDVLRNNGVPEQKIIYMPQGLPSSFGSNVTKPAGKGDGFFRIGYVGRISPEKGVDLLVKAFLKLDLKHIRLFLHGVREQNQSDFEKYVRKLACRDNRIQFMTRVPHEKILDAYNGMDVLAVPSKCPETGPLVIWEALSRGVPVIASPLIGHPDLLYDSVGKIVQDHSVRGWTTILDNLANGKIILKVPDNLKLRTMKTVGCEVADLYKKVIRQNSHPDSSNLSDNFQSGCID